MKITRFDHLVLRVHDIEASCKFYNQVLGMEVRTFGDNRKALHFGDQKINLQDGTENVIVAASPVPGSADICFITEEPLDHVIAHLTSCGVVVEEGPIQRTGALGRIQSVYIRDLDGNLIEISNYTST